MAQAFLGFAPGEACSRFSYTGLTEPQCERLLKEFHIYLLKSGRISMAGINEGNVRGGREGGEGRSCCTR